jgi:hypothetical protein
LLLLHLPPGFEVAGNAQTSPFLFVLASWHDAFFLSLHPLISWCLDSHSNIATALINACGGGRVLMMESKISSVNLQFNSKDFEFSDKFSRKTLLLTEPFEENHVLTYNC